MPTETVYGVAVDPAAPGALARLYAAKGRDAGKPVALLAADLDSLRARGVTLNPLALRLARRFWPGPLTLVVDTPRGPTGYRVPDHPVTRAVLVAAGTTLAASSANRSGEPPALTAEAALAALGEHVALVLDAGRADGGVPSTVVRIRGARLDFIREGTVPRETIERAAAGGAT